MQHWQPAGDHLPDAIAALRAGKLIGLPTETVYGLAGNALDPTVVARIFEAKQRPTFDPLIIHCADTESAFALCTQVPATARRLADLFWPGPLTLVLPKSDKVPDLISSGLRTVAIRVPAHPLAHELLSKSPFPLAAPSANRFGGISPTTASHVISELGDSKLVAGVLDAGPCTWGVESTVVGFPEADRPIVLRLGSLPVETLSEYVDNLEVLRAYHAIEDVERTQKGEQSPGMLERHYAPGTRMTLLDAEAELPPTNDRIGLLRWTDRLDIDAPQQVLSEEGDVSEAAANLFAHLRALDERGLDHLYAWKVPDEGLGKAINDRLFRAAE